jgi:hypothetical protein
MGHEIRQLCEIGKAFTITKPRALVKRNRSSCAFCEMIASRLRLGSEKNEGDNVTWRKGDPRPGDGIDELTVVLENRRSKRRRETKLAVFTTEG